MYVVGYVYDVVDNKASNPQPRGSSPVLYVYVCMFVCRVCSRLCDVVDNQTSDPQPRGSSLVLHVYMCVYVCICVYDVVDNKTSDPQPRGSSPVLHVQWETARVTCQNSWTGARYSTWHRYKAAPPRPPSPPPLARSWPTLHHNNYPWLWISLYHRRSSHRPARRWGGCCVGGVQESQIKSDPLKWVEGV